MLLHFAISEVLKDKLIISTNVNLTLSNVETTISCFIPVFSDDDVFHIFLNVNFASHYMQCWTCSLFKMTISDVRCSFIRP